MIDIHLPERGQTPNWTAQPGQVFSGVTFSNENESGLVGEYHGPPGCIEPGEWRQNMCKYHCYFKYIDLPEDYMRCSKALCDVIALEYASWEAMEDFCM